MMEKVWIWAVGADLVPTHGPGMDAEFKGGAWNRGHSEKGRGHPGWGCLGPAYIATELCLFAAPSFYPGPVSRATVTLLGNQHAGVGTQKPRRLKEVAWVHSCAGRKLAASPKGHPGVPSVASCKASCVLMKHLVRVTGSFPPSDRGGPGSKE